MVLKLESKLVKTASSLKLFLLHSSVSDHKNSTNDSHETITKAR